MVDYLHEVEHQAERILRLERSIDTAIETLPQKMRAVIDALQSLRGIAKVSAVSIWPRWESCRALSMHGN